jgi:hypothetical protein
VPVVERAALEREVAGHRPLLAEDMPNARDGEIVPANWDRRRRCDGERLRQSLEIAGQADTETVAVLEFDRELAVR